MKLLLLLLLTAFLVQARVYDVTTIYRLTAGLEEATAPTLEERQKASCLIGSSGCNDWTKKGWTDTDSGLSGVTFPASDRLPGDRNATLSRTVTSELFDISVTNQGGHDGVHEPVFMVFSTGVDESVSDLLVLRLADWTGQSVSAFRCLLGQFGEMLSLPDGTERRCNEFGKATSRTRFSQNSEQYRIHLTSDSLLVKRISDLAPLFHVSDVNQLKDIKFFRMIAEDGDVQHTKAVSVLSLTSKSGSLRSAPLHHRNSAAVCVSLSAFVDARSGGSLTVTALYDDGRRLPLGRVFAAEEASSRKAESWKFSTLVDPSEQRSFQIDIQADRLADFPVLIADLTRCSEPERAEIHARTNARGLPFLLSNGAFADPDVGVAFQGCNSQGSGCPWQKSNWNLTPITSSPALGDDLLFSSTNGNNFTETFRFYTFSGFSILPFNDQRDDYNSVINILLLTSSASNAEGSNMYVIRLHGGLTRYNGHRAELIKCSQYNGYSQYSFTGSYARKCQLMTKSTAASQYGFKGRTNPLLVSVNIVQNRVIVHVDGTKIFDWSDSTETYKITNIKFGTYQMSAKVSVEASVFAMNVKNTSNDNEEDSSDNAVSATMTSPAFYTSAKKACVVVHYYTDDSRSMVGIAAKSNEGLVTAAAERTETAVVDDVKGPILGWRRDTFEVALPGGGGPHFITLTAAKPDNAELWVQRIAGCNLQDDEDVRVFSNDSSLLIVRPGFEVAALDRAVSLTEDECAHGGRVVNGSQSECVCPAGFTGENCEKGCGANRYGADCGGRCSATERGCRGMLLCRPLLGCACAPGLTGPLCDQSCRRGQFGAGCAQACGRCAGNASCDIHTGECFDGCQPGFYPPLCQYKYKKLSEAPVAKLVKDTWKITFSLDELDGRGSAMFYQVQYSQLSATTWSSLPARPVVPGAVEAELPALSAGRRYEARVKLIDRNGDSYDGYDVPHVEFDTPCHVSENSVELTSENVTETSFSLTWKPLAEVFGSCPTTGYELRVKMGWEWQSTHLGNDTTSVRFGNDKDSIEAGLVKMSSVPGANGVVAQRERLLPGRTYPVQIRALSASGPGPFSGPGVVTTLNTQPPGRITDLRTTSSGATRLDIAWNEPRNGRVAKYRIDYQCELLLACPDADCTDSRGSLETTDLSATLTDLAPLARYKVAVTTVPSGAKHPATIVTSTLQDVPRVAPSAAAQSVSSRSNSSLSVRWRGATSCARLNGFALGYAAQLWRAGLEAPVTAVNTTIGDESATFDGLQPHTNYTVKVFVVTSSGWNADFPLEFVAKTRATTPGPVRALTLYKRGRRMLGLRWAAPRVTYGPLRSFTVSYGPSSPGNPGNQSEQVVLTPTPCAAWPDLFCHTIDRLQPDTEYTVTVVAQNTEVEEDGEEESLLAVTKEGTPAAPTSVQLSASTTTALTVQWRLPDFVNGQLRSFLVNVEQTDSANASDCCQDFPMREVMVKTEEPRYQLEMPGLLPASSYLLSVSAKTVALGPSASVTGHTRPSAPEMPPPPVVQYRAPDSIVVKLHSAPHHDLLSGQLLLLASSEETARNDTAGLDIFDPWLAAELASVNATLYLVDEFTHDRVESQSTLTLGQEPIRGRFGLIQAPLLQAGTTYQLVQVAVLDYCGVLSLGIVRSTAFGLN